jgi:hypothetical protein
MTVNTSLPIERNTNRNSFLSIEPLSNNKTQQINRAIANTQSSPAITRRACRRRRICETPRALPPLRRHHRLQIANRHHYHDNRRSSSSINQSLRNVRCCGCCFFFFFASVSTVAGDGGVNVDIILLNNIASCFLFCCFTISMKGKQLCGNNL